MYVMYCIYTCVCACARMHACVRACVCVCVCVCRVFGGLTGVMDPGGMPAATLW